MKLKKSKTNLSIIIMLLIISGYTNLFGNVNNPEQDQVNYFYEFSHDEEGWIGDFADYPKGEEGFYELLFEYSKLPFPLDQNKGALRVFGNNHSDDLFMFIKRKVSGLLSFHFYISVIKY